MASYWEDRLRKQFNERGSGHRGFSLDYNLQLYQSKTKAVLEILGREQITLKGSTLLDVGCGTGFFESLAMNHGVQNLTGVDVSETSVRMLTPRFPSYKFLNVNICQCRDQRWEAVFDGVVALDVLYCLRSDAEFEESFGMLAKSLKPGGWFLVSDRFYRLIGLERHVKFRPWSMYESLAHRHGLVLRQRMPLYITLTRPVIPVFGPLVLNPLGALFKKFDAWFRQRGPWTVRWLANLSLALFTRSTP